MINPFDDIVLRNITVNKEKNEKVDKINKMETQALQPKKPNKSHNENILYFIFLFLEKIQILICFLFKRNKKLRNQKQK